MDSIQVNLNKTLNAFEECLNVAGYVPIVSTFSGALRVGYGQIEIIGSVAAGGLLAIVALFTFNENERQKGLNQAVMVIITYSLHGVANIFRGRVEMVPFLSLVTCLPYDHLLKARFAYPVEIQAPLLQDA